ncbi:MAG: 7-cyano-7-deazaguanine synthase QueC [Candidatus Latescibacterota bacterium]|nr:7-cyano-7-deazaguanine synthase QueC [Candidatus Latescibacterota bacterium]
MQRDQEALVLFSGGQDSATCLAWALEKFNRVETIGFDYGQRHSVELTCRLPILEEFKKQNSEWKAKLGDDHLIDLNVLGQISQTSLTKPVEIEISEQGLPNTFVPGRNLMFLTLSASIAYRRGIKNLVTGVCETDYSGYPDCRDDAIKAMQVVLNLGMETRFVLHTPLMWIDKASTWDMAEKIGGSGLIEVMKEFTHTCYNGNRSNRLEWGYGCNECPACELRAAGYQKFIS